MSLQRLRSSKPPLTLGAPVWLLSGVDSQVSAVTVWVIETLAALFTPVRLFSSVDSQVSTVVSQPTKAFPTLITFVRFLSGVREHMLLVRL